MTKMIKTGHSKTVMEYVCQHLGTLNLYSLH